MLSEAITAPGARPSRPHGLVVVRDCGSLYRRNGELLLAHEDKTYPGAVIASLSIPWGEAKSDDGGYHLVWTRDMVNSVTGLVATDDLATALRALIYLACAQRPDGGFPQNFCGSTASPTGTAFSSTKSRSLSCLVADAQTRRARYPTRTHGAARRLLPGLVTDRPRRRSDGRRMPVCQFTNIAGLICAACFAHYCGDLATARFLEEYADFLEQQLRSNAVFPRGDSFVTAYISGPFVTPVTLASILLGIEGKS